MSLDRSGLFEMDLRTYDAYKINQAREEEIREKELNKNVLKNQWYIHKPTKSPEFVTFDFARINNKIEFHSDDIRRNLHKDPRYATLNNKIRLNEKTILTADIIA